MRVIVLPLGVSIYSNAIINFIRFIKINLVQNEVTTASAQIATNININDITLFSPGGII